MDDIQDLVAQLRELVHPAPRPSKAPKVAALLASFVLILGFIKFVIEWRRVPTMPKVRESDVGTLGE